MSEGIEFQAELYADYLNFERGLSPLTTRAYGRELERFITFATERGRRDPGAVTADDVRDYATSHCNHRTVHHQRSIVFAQDLLLDQDSAAVFLCRIERVSNLARL